MEVDDNLRINKRTKMKRVGLTAFSEGDYFISINCSFAIEWKGRKFIKNSTSFHFLNQMLNNHSDQDH